LGERVRADQICLDRRAQAFPAVPRLLDAAAEQALKDFTPPEREQLVALLERLASNLDWPPPRRPKP
jgi:hypothetical protein